MKIKKIIAKQIGQWIEENIPEDISLLAFPKMLSDFQNHIAKINLTAKKIPSRIICKYCGKSHDAQKAKVLDYEFYVSPHGCTGGDYWAHDHYVIQCAGCGFYLRIPQDDCFDMDLSNKETIHKDGELAHQDCVITHKTIYV
jgi:hypothetical protein